MQLRISEADREAMGMRSVGSRPVVAGGFAVTALIATMVLLALPSAAPSSGAAASVPRPAKPKPAAAATNVSSVVADPAIRRFTGLVGPNLSRSLEDAGVPERQGRAYVALLGRAIQLANGLSVDDKFDLILERNPDGSLGQLLYVGMARIARPDVELMKWTDGKHAIWINADGVGGNGGESMRMPVQGHLTSNFGERFHPILGYVRFHAGIDLGAPAGTPIVAAADGKVLSAGWTGGYGRAVEILHADGIETKYGHMSRIAAYPGEVVRGGDVIGYVGSTGLSTGPHLHFEVMKNGRPVDPLSVKVIAGGPAQLAGTELVSFQDQLRKLLLAAAG